MKKALIVLSGGQDSTLSIFAMMNQGFNNLEAITFDYGQRHKIEIECAKRIAQHLNIPLTVMPINTFASFSKSALTSDIAVSSELQENQLPNTFVPGRNIIFLTFAAAYAYQKGIKTLVTGVSQEDYSGYPDCREDTIISLEETLQFALEFDINIQTPMMHISKAEALIRYAKDNDAARECLAMSHTCYNGQFPPCNACPACLLRANSFAEAGMIDPLTVLK